jgi:hypothetical protein
MAAIAGVLAVTLGYLLAAPNAEYDVPAVRRAALPTVSLPAPFVPPPLAEFGVIDERPLFVADRRPFREPVDAPPPRARPRPPDATLVGIILDGGRKVAIARAGGKAITLIPGAELNGWKVVSIESDRIALKAEDEVHEIKLPKPVARPSVQARVPRPTPPPGFAPGQTPGAP